MVVTASAQARRARARRPCSRRSPKRTGPRRLRPEGPRRAVHGAHPRAGRRPEPRPRDLLARLRPHPARPRAVDFGVARRARRRAAARGRHDPRPPLDGPRVRVPPDDIDEERRSHGALALAEHPRRDRGARRGATDDPTPARRCSATSRAARSAAASGSASATAAGSRSSPRTRARRSSSRPTRRSRGSACASRCGCAPRCCAGSAGTTCGCTLRALRQPRGGRRPRRRPARHARGADRRMPRRS